MSDWVTDIDDTTARLERWNKRRGIVRTSGVVADPATEVPMVVYFIVDEPLTGPQETALQDLLTDETMPDATAKTYLTTLRAKVKVCRVEGGIKAPADLVALPDKVWRAVGELRLRCDDAPPEPPPE